MATAAKLGDFGLSNRLRERTQIVGIYDLVGYTRLDSNRDLVQAVRMLETELQLHLSPDFRWDERKHGGDEKPTNDILLRSTGDGYIVAFSQEIDDLRALEHLKTIHTRVHESHAVRLGINKGKNYVAADVNERVNVLGWGINFAARALQFAEAGQIICTEYFAGPIIQTDKRKAQTLVKIGARTIKNTELVLYNYYKAREFGAPLNNSQKTSRRSAAKEKPKKRKRQG